jgi:hypothetical protein
VNVDVVISFARYSPGERGAQEEKSHGTMFQGVSFRDSPEAYQENKPSTYDGLVSIRHRLSHLAAWRISRGTPHPLQYLFDWMKSSDPSSWEIETIMEQAERQAAKMQPPLTGEYVQHDFRPRKDHPGLQVGHQSGCPRKFRYLQSYRREVFRPHERSPTESASRRQVTPEIGTAVIHAGSRAPTRSPSLGRRGRGTCRR